MRAHAPMQPNPIRVFPSLTEFHLICRPALSTFSTPHAHGCMLRMHACRCESKSKGIPVLIPLFQHCQNRVHDIHVCVSNEYTCTTTRVRALIHCSGMALVGIHPSHNTFFGIHHLYLQFALSVPFQFHGVIYLPGLGLGWATLQERSRERERERERDVNERCHKPLALALSLNWMS